MPSAGSCPIMSRSCQFIWHITVGRRQHRNLYLRLPVCWPARQPVGMLVILPACLALILPTIGHQHDAPNHSQHPPKATTSTTPTTRQPTLHPRYPHRLTVLCCTDGRGGAVRCSVLQTLARLDYCAVPGSRSLPVQYQRWTR